MSAPTLSDFWQGIDPYIHQQMKTELGQTQFQTLIQDLQISTSKSSTVQERYHALESIARQHNIVHTLGMIQHELHDYIAAEATWRLMLRGNHHSRPNLAALSNLALDLEQQKKYADAEAVLRALTPLLQSRVGQHSPQALGAIRMLSKCIHRQGRYDEARVVIAEVSELLDQISDETAAKDERAALEELEGQLRAKPE